MREVFSCSDCAAPVRYAETAESRFVVLNATPTGDAGSRARFAIAAPGRVIRTQDTIAFLLHRCPAQLAPAADAPRRDWVGH